MRLLVFAPLTLDGVAIVDMCFYDVVVSNIDVVYYYVDGCVANNNYIINTHDPDR